MSPCVKVFLDASVFVAAAGSPAGGSSKIILMAEKKKIRLLTTRTALNEAERNIKKKMDMQKLLKFYTDIGTIEPEIVEETYADEEARWRALTADRDVHILAGAIKAGADVLISLDRRHILSARVKDSFPIPLMEPGEFLGRWGA
jgi:putative PIN family toxin of toxin-antitoxin system